MGSTASDSQSPLSDTATHPGSGQTRPVSARALMIWRGTVLIGCVAIAVWLHRYTPLVPDEIENPGFYISAWILLTGLSLAGPVLAWNRRRSARRCGLGATLWFACGVFYWLLGLLYLGPGWREPPLLLRMYVELSAVPMAMLSVLLATLLGRGRSSRRLRELPWAERFGMYLALAWSFLGLCMIYEFCVVALEIEWLPRVID